MPNIETLLNASQFDGLAIDKTPNGAFTASFLTAEGWSPFFTAPRAADAIAAALSARVIIPPCPVSIPPCPVPAL